MSKSLSVTTHCDRKNRVPSRLVALMRFGVAGLASLTAIVIVVVCIGLHITPLRARDVARPASIVKEKPAAPSALFTRHKPAEAARTTRAEPPGCAREILRHIEEYERLEREAADRETDLQEARNGYENARSARARRVRGRRV